MAREYWDYYSSDYAWNDEGKFPIDKKFSEDCFSSVGFSDSQVQDLIRSGYVVSGDLVIDRYYGGWLLSSDLRSRIKLERFSEEPFYKRHSAYVHHASSVSDIEDRIEKWQQTTARQLVFRGQNRSYSLRRARPNPAYTVDEFGEISLVPSLWRRMLNTGNIGREYFTNISMSEWSKILYSDFDLAEVARRQQAALDGGEWIYTTQDMEDSDDPLLHEFGKRRLDVTMELGYNLRVPTQTLLQHYGLLSPLLDLSADLEVALFFATYKFLHDSHSNRCSYEFIGTNNRQSVIYVFRENSSEMQTHEHHRALKIFKPQRPLRQSCMVAYGGTDAINLPLEFLFGVIVLDFDDVRSNAYTGEILFPSTKQDRFLTALVENIAYPQHLTIF